MGTGQKHPHVSHFSPQFVHVTCFVVLSPHFSPQSRSWTWLCIMVLASQLSICYGWDAPGTLINRSVSNTTACPQHRSLCDSTAQFSKMASCLFKAHTLEIITPTNHQRATTLMPTAHALIGSRGPAVDHQLAMTPACAHYHSNINDLEGKQTWQFWAPQVLRRCGERSPNWSDSQARGISSNGLSTRLTVSPSHSVHIIQYSTPYGNKTTRPDWSQALQQPAGRTNWSQASQQPVV